MKLAPLHILLGVPRPTAAVLAPEARSRGHHLVEIGAGASLANVDVAVVDVKYREIAGLLLRLSALPLGSILLVLGGRAPPTGEVTVLSYAGTRVMRRLIDGIEAVMRIVRGQGAIWFESGAAVDERAAWAVVDGELVSVGMEGGRLLRHLVVAGEGGVARADLMWRLKITAEAADKAISRLRVLLHLRPGELTVEAGHVVLRISSTAPDWLSSPLPSAPFQRRLLLQAAQFRAPFSIEQLIGCLEGEEPRVIAMNLAALADQRWVIPDTTNIPWKWSVPRRERLERVVGGETMGARDKWYRWTVRSAAAWLSRIRTGPRVSEGRLEATAALDDLFACWEIAPPSERVTLALTLAEVPSVSPTALWEILRSTLEGAPRDHAEYMELAYRMVQACKYLGRFEEGLHLLERERMYFEASPLYCCRMEIARAALLYTARRVEEAHLALEAAAANLSLAPTLLPRFHRIEILFEHDPMRRRKKFEEIRTECRSLGDDWMEAIHTGNQAIFMTSVEAVGEAYELFEYAIRKLREAKDQRYAGIFTSAYANMLLARGLLVEAEVRHAEAVQLAIIAENTKSEAIARVNHAVTLMLLGRCAEAEEEVCAGRVLAAQQSNVTSHGNALGVLAHLRLVQQDPTGAAALFEEAAEIFESARLRRAAALARLHAAAVHDAVGLPNRLVELTDMIRSAWGQSELIRYTLAAVTRAPWTEPKRTMHADYALADLMRDALSRVQ